MHVYEQEDDHYKPHERADANYNFEIILQGSLYVVLEIKWIVICRRQMSRDKTMAKSEVINFCYWIEELLEEAFLRQNLNLI